MSKYQYYDWQPLDRPPAAHARRAGGGEQAVLPHFRRQSPAEVTIA